jgi:hypothetical protein
VPTLIDQRRKAFPGFIGGFGELRSRQAGVERTVNWFPERLDRGLWLRGAPGLTAFATLGGGPVRKLFYQDGRAFAVSGNRFFEFFSDGTSIERGVVLNDGRPATIVSNGAIGRQLFVVSGMAGYIYNLTTDVLTQISDADFPTAVLLGLFADSYFLALWSGAPKFSYSTLADGSAWAAVDVAQKSQTSDNLLAMIYDHKELWLLGSKQIEIWFNSGDNRNPWTPQPILIEQGIDAADSIAKGGDSLFWLQGSEQGGKKVVQAAGYNAVPIGSQALHTRIATYTRTNDAIGWYQGDEGHGFYWLTFPTEEATWCYDTTTKIWSERLFWNQAEGVYEAHHARCHAYAYDKHLVGSRHDGTVYQLTYTAYDDAGDLMRRLRRTPHVSHLGHAVSHNRLELDMEVGHGLVSGQGVNPKAMLRYSDDGGVTFSNEEMATLGEMGDYEHTVYWHRLGSSRNRVYEVTVTDPIYVGIHGAYLETD